MGCSGSKSPKQRPADVLLARSENAVRELQTQLDQSEAKLAERNTEFTRLEELLTAIETRHRSLEQQRASEASSQELEVAQLPLEELLEAQAKRLGPGLSERLRREVGALKDENDRLKQQLAGLTAALHEDSLRMGAMQMRLDAAQEAGGAGGGGSGDKAGARSGADREKHSSTRGTSSAGRQRQGKGSNGAATQSAVARGTKMRTKAKAKAKAKTRSVPAHVEFVD